MLFSRFWDVFGLLKKAGKNSIEKDRTHANARLQSRPAYRQHHFRPRPHGRHRQHRQGMRLWLAINKSGHLDRRR